MISARLHSLLTLRVANILADGGEVLFITDFDGTQSLFTPFPDEADLPPERVEFLSQLAKTRGFHVEVCTGRPLRFMQKILPEPEIGLRCSYGLEERVSGAAKVAPEITTLTNGINKLKNIILQVAKEQGIGVSFHAREAAREIQLYIEEKIDGWAIHTAPPIYGIEQLKTTDIHKEDLREQIKRNFDLLETNLKNHGYSIHTNNGNIEVLLPHKAAGTNKGTKRRALEKLYNPRLVIVCGDDIKDLPMFFGKVPTISIAVNNPPGGGRSGTPAVLREEASLVVPSQEALFSLLELYLGNAITIAENAANAKMPTTQRIIRGKE